ncbi:unnamed protein product [Protopolystoma xenopodis]|uniref:Uncharacterized protein n=1 Tax=Protopolystoma xenopodis TaxID=117903 RepID=A0A448WV95_9PLAT|nr:unnamed protein product [Protopolystoma xenopodis]
MPLSCSKGIFTTENGDDFGTWFPVTSSHWDTIVCSSSSDLSTSFLPRSKTRWRPHRLHSLTTSGCVNQLAFAHGDPTACRLPHRADKRRCLERDAEGVTLLIVGLASGLIEVYNITCLRQKKYILDMRLPPVPNRPPPGLDGDELPAQEVPFVASKLVLLDDHEAILRLAVAPDGSLRVASVSNGGTVRLWDIWDDGNMYANLGRQFAVLSRTKSVSLPAVSASPLMTVASLGEGALTDYCCCVAWHPGGEHLFIGGEKGYGLVLEQSNLNYVT